MGNISNLLWYDHLSIDSPKDSSISCCQTIRDGPEATTDTAISLSIRVSIIFEASMEPLAPEIPTITLF